MARLSLGKLERHLYSAADRLRQEGLDAATYKDYIFGMLFLKRCSDVFDAERERIVARKIEQGMAVRDAEATYGENPDYYDGFFVPERARWTYLQMKLNDATESYGSVLDKALGALSEANDILEHVLDHIQFLRTQGNKRILSDESCKDLVRHFGRYRLRNEDFQFIELKRFSVIPGDLLFARQGATTGRNALADKRANGALINYHIIRVATDRSQCEPLFLHAIFNAESALRQINRDKGRGTREGINTKQISSLRFGLPSIDEQRLAVAVLSRHDEQANAEETSLIKLHQIKSGLMADLLTGCVRVPETIARSKV
jgi:hypothetical protein